MGQEDVDRGSDGTTDERLSERIEAVLADQRRRYALYCLYVYSDPMTLPDIADQVTEWEYGEPAEALLDERLRIYMSLYHDHVPPMEDAGLVSYSQEADLLELTDRAGELRARIERLVEEDLRNVREF